MLENEFYAHAALYQPQAAGCNHQRIHLKIKKKLFFSSLLIYNTLHPCVCQHARACDATLGGLRRADWRGSVVCSW